MENLRTVTRTSFSEARAAQVSHACNGPRGLTPVCWKRWAPHSLVGFQLAKITFWLCVRWDAGRTREMVLLPGVVSPLSPTNRSEAQRGERSGDVMGVLRR